MWTELSAHVSLHTGGGPPPLRACACSLSGLLGRIWREWKTLEKLFPKDRRNIDMIYKPPKQSSIRVYCLKEIQLCSSVRPVASSVWGKLPLTPCLPLSSVRSWDPTVTRRGLNKGWLPLTNNQQLQKWNTNLNFERYSNLYKLQSEILFLPSVTLQR